jgi:hypothetical protein
LHSTSAMPLMPMPPIPTKWMGPISRGSLMLGSPRRHRPRRRAIQCSAKLLRFKSAARVLDAPLSPGMTRAILPAAV